MTHLKMILVALLVSLFCFSAVAMPAGADLAPDAGQAVAAAFPDAVEQPGEYASKVFDALRHRQWGLFFVALLIGIVGLLRKFSGWAAVKWAGKVAGRVFAFFLTDRGGTLLSLLSVSLAWIAGELALGHAFSVTMLIDAIMAGSTVIGSYLGLKRVTPTGEDKAQLVAVQAAAMAKKASNEPTRLADLINAEMNRARKG